MYLVNNAQLTRLPFFSRLFRPPGIFSPRISRFIPFPSVAPCRRRAERWRKPKKFRRGQRESTKSHSFDPMRARETGEIERESLRVLTRARAHNSRVYARACNVHPRALQTLVLDDVRGFAGFDSAVPGRPCKNEVQRGTERLAGKGDEGKRVVSFGDWNRVLRSRWLRVRKK